MWRLIIRRVAEHPEYLIHGNADDARDNPSSYIESGGTVFALGRDPFFQHGLTSCS